LRQAYATGRINQVAISCHTTGMKPTERDAEALTELSVSSHGAF